MTAQELYQIVRKEIDVRASTDPAFRQAQRNIDRGNGDFTDSAQCSRILAKILGEKLANHILELGADEGRSEVCQRLLKDHFDELSRKFEQVQTSQDRKHSIGLGTVKPQFPSERVQNVAGSLNDTTVSDETIQRRCRNAVANVANSMHDDLIQENAKFRNDAGLQVTITRTGGADCCEWCAEVSGTFWGYNRDLREVFRRHDNCTCTITYSSSKTRSRLVGESDGAGGTTHKWVESQKSWQEKPDVPDYQPFRMSQEQARAFEEEQLRKLGLTTGGDSGRINTSRKMSAPLQQAPDFSKYPITENPESVETMRRTISQNLGIPESSINLSGVRNTEVLEPFVKRLQKIQADTGMTFPKIIAMEVVAGDVCCIANYQPMENTFYISTKVSKESPASIGGGGIASHY